MLGFRLPLRLKGALLLACLAGCPSEAPSGRDAGSSALLTGLRQGLAVAAPPPWDGGVLTVGFVSMDTVELWPADPAALRAVMHAVGQKSGIQLSRALEPYASVPAELQVQARAAAGGPALAGAALAALLGPLSQPFGGLHAPLRLGQAGLELVKPGLCEAVLGTPGAVGRLLPGVGKSGAVFLLAGKDLETFTACVAAAAPAKAGAQGARQRLTGLLESGRRLEVAVLMGLGVRG